MTTSKDAGAGNWTPLAGDVEAESAEDAMATSAAVTWLVRGVIAEHERALMFADSGVGKSNAGVDLAASVAFDKPWHGHEVKQGAQCSTRQRRILATWGRC